MRTIGNVGHGEPPPGARGPRWSVCAADDPPRTGRMAGVRLGSGLATPGPRLSYPRRHRAGTQPKEATP